jgi:hypothetical protein
LPAFVFLLPVSIVRADEVINGNFSDGLKGWTASGNVEVSAEVAILSDNSQVAE